MKDILSELTRGLGSYNSSVNSSINAVNKSLMVIGYILVSILFLIEMLSWYRFIRNQGGEMTWKLFLEVAVKYFIAYFLVAQSGNYRRSDLATSCDGGRNCFWCVTCDCYFTVEVTKPPILPLTSFKQSPSFCFMGLRKMNKSKK
ncbi:hypothetical protein [Streptococcus anginosus]|uniref:hypothetical protein n=1 Tax=Streptococcus anginosus TaxID=1328 RepID=UPI0038CD49A3